MHRRPCEHAPGVEPMTRERHEHEHMNAVVACAHERAGHERGPYARGHRQARAWHANVRQFIVRRIGRCFCTVVVHKCSKTVIIN
jgi:hypothetical protein